MEENFNTDCGYTWCEQDEVQPEQKTSEQQTPEQKKESRSERFKNGLKNYFTATRIAYIALFTALSYVVYLLDFSLLPGSPVSFLKLDFSNVFVMIGGFALGPVAGVIIGVLKEVIHALTVGNTAFVGELANILYILSYILIPSIVYKKHKGIKTVILTLVLGCICQCLFCWPISYFLTFPAFLKAYGGSWQAGQQLFLDTWYWVILFNLIKTVSISIVVMLLYKPLSKLIKLTNAKFQSLKKKA